METKHIFPKEENPDWPKELRVRAAEFWRKWIGPNVIGYDVAIQDIGELIDLALEYGKGKIK